MELPATNRSSRRLGPIGRLHRIAFFRPDNILDRSPNDNYSVQTFTILWSARKTLRLRPSSLTNSLWFCQSEMWCGRPPSRCRSPPSFLQMSIHFFHVARLKGGPKTRRRNPVCWIRRIHASTHSAQQHVQISTLGDGPVWSEPILW